MQTNRLRPYQIEGVKRIIELGRDVLLADEPGLGKTVQVAEVINRTRPAGVRVVCPASLRLNWARELEVWLTFRPAAVEIMSYEAVVSAKDTLPEVDLLVFEEAHYLKNPDAKRTRKCLALTAKKRLFLTGTPVVNRPWTSTPCLTPWAGESGRHTASGTATVSSKSSSGTPTRKPCGPSGTSPGPRTWRNCPPC